MAEAPFASDLYLIKRFQSLQQRAQHIQSTTSLASTFGKSDASPASDELPAVLKYNSLERLSFIESQFLQDESPSFKETEDEENELDEDLEDVDADMLDLDDEKESKDGEEAEQKKPEKKKEKKKSTPKEKSDFDKNEAQIDLSRFSVLRNPVLASQQIQGKSVPMNAFENDKLSKESVTRSFFFNQFRSLINNELFHDVVFYLTKEQKQVYAHKLILRLRSEYFRVMFNSGMGESAEGIAAKIEVEDFSEDIFMRMLEFIYTGDLRISNATCIPLMQIANQYQVDGIHSLLSRYFKESMDAENVCYLLEEACFYEAQSVIDTCLRFIDSNAENVFKSSTLKFLSAETLIKILMRRTLEIEEIKLFECVYNWCQVRSNNLKQEQVEQLKQAQQSVDEVDEDVPMEELAKDVPTPKELFDQVSGYIQWPIIDSVDLRDRVEYKYPNLVPKKLLLDAYRFHVTGELSKDLMAFGRYYSSSWKFDPKKMGSTISLANHNLTVSKQANNTSSCTVLGDKIFSKIRKYYFAVKIEDCPTTSYIMVGVTDPTTIASNYNNFLSHNQRGYAYYSYQGSKYHNSGSATYGPSYTKGDEIGCLVDFKKKTITFFKNGQNLGVAYSDTIAPPLAPAVTLYSPQDKISVVKSPKFAKVRV